MTQPVDEALYARIHALVMSARQTVARSVDLVQVRTNFEIGRHVVEHEQQGQGRAAHGAALLKQLAARLTEAFGRGFAKRNLEYMRRFYLTYQERRHIAQSATGLSQLATSPAAGPSADTAQFETGQSPTPLPI